MRLLPLSRDGGFTLLEVISALMVLGLILAGLAQLTHFGGVALSTQTRFSARAEEVARLDRTLRHLFENACPPLAADDKVLTGQDHRLLVVSRTPDQPAAPLGRRAQVALGVDEQHRLVLRLSPHPNAQYLPPVPPVPVEIVLLTGVDHIDLSYRKPLADGGAWIGTWGEGNLPVLVRLHIAFTEAGRVWPDMIFPTIVDSNGSF